MIRIGQGMSEYVCPACGAKELRAGRFILIAEIDRKYKGEELRLPEICSAKVTYPNLFGAYVCCLAEMVWTPTQASNDLLGENFIVDVGNGPLKLSSLTEVRNLERGSLRKAANGEGAPLNFRHLSMNSSNRDSNSLKGSTYETGKQIPFSQKTQSGQPIRARAKREND